MRYRHIVTATLVMAALGMSVVVACTQDASAPSQRRSPNSVFPAPVPTPTLDAAALVVAPDGDDSAGGTAAAPLRTIDAAAERAQPGDTILVRAGTYEGDVHTAASGTETARITYVAESPETRIVGTGRDDGAWENVGEYVDIIGFDISGPNEDGLYNQGSNVRLIRNRVHGIAGNCIYVQNPDYSVTEVDVLSNVTFDCGEDKLDHGIYVTHRGGRVANNISYGNAGYGIQCWHACNSIAIVNNLVFSNPEGGIVIGADDDDFETGNSLVANNIVVANGRSGIRETGESGDNNRFLNNLLWNNERDAIALNGGDEQGTIVADPQFVDFRPDGSGDYRLAPTSPAVDSGDPEVALQFAFDRSPRPLSSGLDVGPYEQ
ncbi:MAG TPA: right-handed parallel beta-helix repeat-containing protein [Pseudonocardia sp.]|jgi:hypothetical protein|uniref:right-handed parallel beta-helix repeat-containing protein n=1 Tax=Pseudonocardia sp. TaxID=60912 RepID=UPI002B4AB3F6|nr:right-handed parallel beta-helix repeat-containing protein [Pseudonocardia sp.]HLU59345.1 right-handed parallel beta-helix repeat-containing protein [Pseudonocardia sp.]